METRKNIDLSAIRARLEDAQGQEYWRSLDQLAQTEEFAAMVQREFPEQAAELKDPVSRRNFLKLMSASLALGGLSGLYDSAQRKNRPPGQGPRRCHPRQASVLCFRHLAWGYWNGHFGREPHGAADQNRRQRRAPLRQQRL